MSLDGLIVTLDNDAFKILKKIPEKWEYLN